MTMLTVAQQAFQKYWFGNPGNSSQAADTEKLYMFILWVSIISFVILMGAMVWFVFKYRRSAQHKNYQVSSSHNTVLELGWSIVPLIVMVPIFFWGMKGYIDKQAAPSDSEEIMVRGRKWDWTIAYDNGGEAGTESARITKAGKAVPVFYLPADRPAKFILTSSDVIHSFFIPDFRTKIDVFPNRYTAMWVEPLAVSGPDNATEWEVEILEDAADPSNKKLTKTKVYGHPVYCAEYCGDNHSEMAAFIRVVDIETYNVMKARSTVIDVTGEIPVVGEKLRARYGCNTCHSIDGTASSGPTWKSGWGHTVPFADGSSGVYDENYIRESILNPNAHVHQGFPVPSGMPPFQAQLGGKPEVIDAFIRYIKYLNGVGGDTGTTPAGEGQPGGTDHVGAHETGSESAHGENSEKNNSAPQTPPHGEEHDSPASGAHE